ncbi:hydroxypyruvate isomerase family protein [Brevibacterium luteolum]|uniref:Hydroxypyruvate isomerase n=1 Tax=Brevibacterium luteolum TaxID=199591 RepID=A0A2N6PEB8_9MICO|nr:TIM barrel protein [Brevibacterium luteolum]PMB97043.1 hydroxypyruvate isomerase [Brevibacterium luteolum]
MPTPFTFTSPDSYVLNCSTLLTELPVMERPAAARAAGFTQVEFWWPFDGQPAPSSGDVDQFVAALDEAGVDLRGLNFWAGDMAGGDRGMVSIESARSDFAANVDLAVSIGERTGCTAFNALYGLRQSSESAETQDQVAVENLRLAAEKAAAVGGTVLVEPVSGADGYPLTTAADALAVVRRVKEQGVDNIGLLADFFHLHVNGDDVAAVIEAHAADFAHVQIADAPGRGAPGTGELPLEQWINRTYELGYTGRIALEYKQDKDTAFDWLSS